MLSAVPLRPERESPWTEQRKAFAFNGKYIIPALMEVLDMSEEDAKRWFNDKDGPWSSPSHSWWKISKTM